MEYTLYKTETFVIDVVVESGKRLIEQREIMEFLEAEGHITQCGSGFEIDLLNDLMDNLDWTRIKKEIKDSSVYGSDTEDEEDEDEDEIETE